MSERDDDDSLPPYLDVADLVRVSELSETTVREHLKRNGLAEKIGNRLMVSRYDLRDRWSSLYRILLAKIAEGMDLRPERPTPSPPQRTALCLLVGPRGPSLALVALRSVDLGPCGVFFLGTPVGALVRSLHSTAGPGAAGS